MSNWLVVVSIPAGMAAFYPLVIGLAQLSSLRTNPHLLKRLHLAGWGFTLLLLVCFMKWSISLRGQWLDALPFGFAWVAAGTYFWLRRKQLSWLGKLYFGGWFGYPAVLALAYLADKILFALVALPLFVFFPATTYYSSPTVTLRAPVSGFLSARRVQLLTLVGFLFEKHVGLTADDLLPTEDDSIVTVNFQPNVQSDSVVTHVVTHHGQHLVKFGR